MRLARLLIGCGSILTIAAISIACRQTLNLRALQKADGRVVEIHEFKESDGRLASETHISFIGLKLTGPSVTTITLRSSIFGADLTPGEHVSVAYPPDRPSSGEVVTWGRVYGWDITFGLLGVIVFDAGWILLICARWRDPSPPSLQSGHERNRRRYAHFFGAGDSQRPFDR